MKKGEDPKSHVSWCLKQKRGIKLEEQNNTLCNVYLKKAKSSLNMLDSADEKNEVEWISTTAYYARYFSFYALLQKCGIKSEIHDCTISLMHYLFVEENIIEQQLYDELQEAKKLRVDMQYYTIEEIDVEKLKKDAQTARKFLLKMEEIIEKLTQENIQAVRKKLTNP